MFYFFLNCLVEFISETMWAWIFFYFKCVCIYVWIWYLNIFRTIKIIHSALSLDSLCLSRDSSISFKNVAKFIGIKLLLIFPYYLLPSVGSVNKVSPSYSWHDTLWLLSFWSTLTRDWSILLIFSRSSFRFYWFFSLIFSDFSFIDFCFNFYYVSLLFGEGG